MKKKRTAFKRALRKGVGTIAEIGFWSAIMPAIGISLIRYHMRIGKKKERFAQNEGKEQ